MCRVQIKLHEIDRNLVQTPVGHSALQVRFLAPGSAISRCRVQIKFIWLLLICTKKKRLLLNVDNLVREICEQQEELSMRKWIGRLGKPDQEV